MKNLQQKLRGMVVKPKKKKQPKRILVRRRDIGLPTVDSRTRYEPVAASPLAIPDRGRARSRSRSRAANRSALPPIEPRVTRSVSRARARNRDRDAGDVRLSVHGIAHSNDELIHVRAKRSLFREEQRGHNFPRLSDNDLIDRVSRGLENLSYRSNLERSSNIVPDGYRLNVPREFPSAVSSFERHYRIYASSYVALFNALASELGKPGVTRVSAFLPYSAATFDATRPGMGYRTPLRTYRSIRDLRENFWADVRRKIRYLYTGVAGDSDKDSVSYAEFDTGVSFLDNPAGIDIYSSRGSRSGSCNTKKTSFPILKGKFSDYRVMNPASNANNCGLHCLIAASKNVPSVKTIRREFNLVSNVPVSEDTLVKIGEKYGLRVEIFTENSDEENLWNALTTGVTCIYLTNNHYKLVMAKTSFYTCPVCKRKLRSKECDDLRPHECSLVRVCNLSTHPNAKVKRFDAAYDIETRNDIRQLREYDIGLLQHPEDLSERVFVLPQVPTLVCMVFKNTEQDVLVRNSFLGVSCMDDFLERLFELHSNYIYLDLYAHNGSRFDSLLVLQAIKANAKYAKYTEVDESVIKGTKILNFKFLNHTFRGTENYLEGSLDKLCKAFKVTDAKKKKIMIKGKEWDTMDLCLMNPEQSPQEFLDFITNPIYIEFQKAYVEYCMYDCISLLQVWVLFKEQMLESVIPVQEYPFLKNVFSSSSTLPGTIMKVFKAVHSKKIEGTNGKSVHMRDYWCPSARNPTVSKLIMDAKLGGISHVAKPGLHIGEISLVDVKSLYPSVMLNKLYPNGEPIELLGDSECRSFIEAGYLAIIRCTKVTMNTNCIADYPARTKSGLDWGANEVIEGALTSIDILRILRHGGTVSMEWGIGWTKQTNPFTSVISKATAIKVEQDHFSETKDPRYNPVLRTATKLSGSALFGKMLESSKNCSWEEFDSFFDYSEFDKEGKYDVRQSNGKFYVKVPEDSETLPPLQFGVFILAHSRQMMQDYFDMVGRENIIASETDSIHCYDRHLLKLRESNDPLYRIGNEYGNMVAEYNGTIRKAYFLAKKCYAYAEMKEGSKDEKKMKCKGVSTNCLTVDFYETLYKTRSSRVENMKVFRRNLFSDVHTGITIEYLTKVIKTGADVEYKEYNEHGPVRC